MNLFSDQEALSLKTDPKWLDTEAAKRGSSSG